MEPCIKIIINFTKNIMKFNNELNQIILFDKEGGTLSYMIKKIRINNSLSDATFKFKPEEYKNIEIIDLRTLRPLDTETVINSVRKTNRCVTVDTSRIY